MDQFEDEDGCPDADNDKDGVADASDKCANEPEDVDQFLDDDGCPDADNDADGIADATDRCPDEGEVFNGVTDDDGCPDAGAPLAQVTDQKIEIRQQVNFASGKARIEKSSFLLLATVAKLLTLHPQIARVRVEGHTDDRGKAEKNLKLSQQRAEAVRDHLVQVNGVEATRLEAAGFGSTQPLVPNLTQKARAQNRRVEFIIVEKAGTPPRP